MLDVPPYASRSGPIKDFLRGHWHRAAAGACGRSFAINQRIPFTQRGEP
jgi:hypothetical protein